MYNLFTFLLSSLSLFVFLKYFLVIVFRIDENYYKLLYDISKKTNYKIILHEEFTDGFRYPIEFSCICKIDKYLIYFDHNERLLNAGWVGKDYTTNLICFRWNYNSIKKYLKDLGHKNSDIPVDLIIPYGSDRIGSITKDIVEPISNIKADYDFIYLFNKDIEKLLNEEISKTSALLYGPPGNGKTFFIKHIAKKYDLPIKVFSFNPEWTNHDILNLFSQIPSRCIVLFEDFDNYFDKRECLIKHNSIKFTFDTILNCFDGVYNNYKSVIFLMTVNDIEKVDDSIKNRPSRFKYLVEFINPNFEIRLKILGDKTLAESTEGYNLDQVFFTKFNL